MRIRTREEIIRLLTSNVSDFNKYREGTNFAPIDLRQVDLSGINLSGLLGGGGKSEQNLIGSLVSSIKNIGKKPEKGANLYKINLSLVDMTDADLRWANMRGDSLYKAKLSGVNLSEADLSGVNLSFANLTNSDLNRSNLNGADLGEVILEGSNLRETDLYKANLIMARFIKS